MDFGCFVQLEGVKGKAEGLVHVSLIQSQPLRTPHDVVSRGQNCYDKVCGGVVGVGGEGAINGKPQEDFAHTRKNQPPTQPAPPHLLKPGRGVCIRVAVETELTLERVNFQAVAHPDAGGHDRRFCPVRLRDVVGVRARR
jgi:hypothetical protein